MRDFVAEVVAAMQKGPDAKLRGGWSRGCPSSREERALIEVWVTFTEKAASVYATDVGLLESKIDMLADKLEKAHEQIVQHEQRVRKSDALRTEVAVKGHIDRHPDLPAEEGTRLLAETSAA